MLPDLGGGATVRAVAGPELTGATPFAGGTGAAGAAGAVAGTAGFAGVGAVVGAMGAAVGA